ncbi:MAG: hypothetical protein WCD79_19615 [Chthoniobacteraceae bacterium]
MGLGTKNRQNQTAEICKEHLREKHKDKRVLVEEFIAETEGTSKNQDPNIWQQFTDMRGKTDEMLERLDAYFDKWLNP